jgi:hypothetical protein
VKRRDRHWARVAAAASLIALIAGCAKPVEPPAPPPPPPASLSRGAQECRHRVLGGEDTHVLLMLAKRRPGERWPALGAPAVRVARPLVTVRPRGASPPRLSAAQLTQYRWSDNKNAATVWVVVPGVHSLPAAAVAVRFRELSFDLTVSDLGGKDFQFAVRERQAGRVGGLCARRRR